MVFLGHFWTILGKVMVIPPLTVTGWGRLNEGGNQPSVLHEVDVPVMTFKECNNFYGGSITESMLCSGFDKGKRDSCQGDTGGPLVTKENDRFALVS